MAVILNTTARQFNLKGLSKDGSRAVVRLVPGLNEVNDDHWGVFVSKDGKKVDNYVAGLKKAGHLKWGAPVDDLELDLDKHTAVSKSEPVAKLQEALNKSASDLKTVEAAKALIESEVEASRAENEALKAENEALKAELGKASKADK